MSRSDTPSPQEIEAVAKAIADDLFRGMWDDLTGEDRNFCFSVAKVAILALDAEREKTLPQSDKMG